MYQMKLEITLLIGAVFTWHSKVGVVTGCLSPKLGIPVEISEPKKTGELSHLLGLVIVD